MLRCFENIEHGKILNIAHRGARSLAPENTLAAARKAFEVGADMWELDVGMTADGELLVIHDSTLSRTSNVATVFPERSPWYVHEFLMDEVRSLDFGSWFNVSDPFGQIAAGAVSKEEMECYHGLAAPTLREALLFTQEYNQFVNIEIKDLRGTAGHARVVGKVVALIEELDVVDRVIVSSFNHGYLKGVKSLNRDIATGALVSRARLTALRLLKGLNAQAYHPHVTAIRRREIRSLRDRGFEVFVWVVNDSKAMASLIRDRVSGIFTDFPQVLKSLLDGSAL